MLGMNHMKKLLALLVSCGCWAIGQQNPCVENLVNELVGCFKQQSLQIRMDTGQQDPNKLMREAQTMDPTVMCPNKEAYKSAISCALSRLKSCLQYVDMDGAVPESQNFQDGMDVVCRRHEQFDSACYKANYHSIITCGGETVRDLIHKSSNQQTTNEVICLSADVNYDCTGTYLSHCGGDTKDIILEQLDKYQVPAACVGKRPGRANRQHYTDKANNHASSQQISSPLYLLAALTPLVYFRLRCQE